MLELDDAVREAVELQVAFGGGLVIEEQDRAVARRKELLEGKDLAPEAQRVASEQPHLGERVEHDEPRPASLDRAEHAVDDFLELHLGGMEQGVGLASGVDVLGRQLETSIPSSVQPCETATSLSSTRLSESVT